MQRHFVGRQVDAVAVPELPDQPVHDPLVPVISTEMVVAAGRLDLDHALAHFSERDAQAARAEVEDHDRGLVGLVEVIGERSDGGVVGQAQHIKIGHFGRFLGGLALRVVEVCGHGDHDIGDGIAQVRLGVPLQLLQDKCQDLLRGQLLPVDGDGPTGAHLPLDGPDRAVNVGHGLALGDFADQHFTVLRERHHRRSSTRPLRVRDDRGLAALKNSDDRVRRAKVNPYRVADTRPGHRGAIYWLRGNAA